jgi:hypothetical protein
MIASEIKTVRLSITSDGSCDGDSSESRKLHKLFEQMMSTTRAEFPAPDRHELGTSLETLLSVVIPLRQRTMHLDRSLVPGGLLPARDDMLVCAPYKERHMFFVTACQPSGYLVTLIEVESVQALLSMLSTRDNRQGT